jgi:hypothetical protein
MAFLLVSHGPSLRAQSNATQEHPGDTAGSTPASSERKRPDTPITAPKVICNGNQLSIVADNSTLASIFSELHRCSGVKIDAPDAASTSTVFDQLGPGPARQIIISLLNATGFNYVIGGSDTDPDKIGSILLISRGAEATPAFTDDRSLTVTRKAFLQMRENARPKPPSERESAGAAESADPAATAAATSPTETPEAAPPPPVASDSTQKTAETPQSSAGNSSTPPADAAPAASPKQPSDDPITNMQQLFEQRRQMMQPPATAPAQTPPSSPQ